MTEITLPIDHLSFSAMSMLCSNQWQFKKNYILNLWDNQCSITALVGKGFHRFAELYFREVNIDKAKEDAIKLMDNTPDKDIDFGKTGSREKALAELSNVIEYFLTYTPTVGEVLGSEVKVTANFDIDGMKSPLPLKAVTDLATRMDGKLWGHDWKVVSKFSDTEKEQGSFVMQAMFNYYTLKAKYGEAPYGFIFWEIKKSKNKNGDPQIQPYQIIFGEHPEYFTYFGRMYSGVIQMLSNQDMVFLPNFKDMYTREESWKDFTAEVMDFKMPKQVSHKSPLKRNVEEIDYVESLSTKVEAEELSVDDMIKSKLLEFAIPVEMVDKHEGANVTLYRMKASRGVSVKKIRSYEDDLALALGAKSVRIEAPIFGTKYIGVEVANDQQTRIDWSKDMLVENSLSLPVGVDVYGKTYTIDLAKAPHLLVAGATGAGKSVGLNVFISSLMEQNNPESLKLLLIDPKRTEFAQFSSSLHLQAGRIITEAHEALASLLWAVEQMEWRYQKLQELGARNIDEYNKLGSMHKIVIVIDELADLILSDLGKDIEKAIVRLAQKARAAGIHIIAATQRPSVNVVTGILKANFPTRISYMVSSRVDSDVVLGSPGAEQLIGNGDLLLMSPLERGLKRLQGYYL